MKQALARTFNAAIQILLGGIVFWTPNIAVHWIRGYRFSNFDVIGLTILLPATTYFFFRFVLWPLRKESGRFSEAWFAVLGIWIAGPSMLTLSASFCGGGLSQPGAWHFFVIGTLLFPVFTLMMSTFDGTVFALLLTSLLLPLFANVRSKRAASPAAFGSW